MSVLFFAFDFLGELARAEVEGLAAAVLDRACQAVEFFLGDLEQREHLEWLRAHPPAPRRSSPPLADLDLCAWPCARVVNGELCGGAIKGGACRRCGRVYRTPLSDEKSPSA